MKKYITKYGDVHWAGDGIPADCREATPEEIKRADAEDMARFHATTPSHAEIVVAGWKIDQNRGKCFQNSTNVYYPDHEYIGGRCAQCGEDEPDENNEQAARLWVTGEKKKGSYTQGNSPVPYMTTLYSQDGAPIARYDEQRGVYILA